MNALEYPRPGDAQTYVQEFDINYIETYHTFSNRPAAIEDSLDRCLEFITLQNLGFRANTALISRCCRSAIHIAHDYFYGDWLHDDRWAEAMNKSGEYLSWLSAYRAGQFFALICNRTDVVKQLANWVEDYLPEDPAARDFTKEDNYFHILLAYFLSERTPQRLSEMTESIEKCRNKRPKLLLRCLRAIRAGDASEFEAALAEYLKRYLKVELKDEFIDDWIAVEGTILWHVARIKGLRTPELKEKEASLIVTMESLGIDEV